jgi:hypothetical protein
MTEGRKGSRKGRVREVPILMMIRSISGLKSQFVDVSIDIRWWLMREEIQYCRETLMNEGNVDGRNV